MINFIQNFKSRQREGWLKILKIFKSSIFSKDLNRVLEILYGADGHEPSGEDVSKLSTEIYQNDLLSG